jgi:hypothetical protein
VRADCDSDGRADPAVYRSGVGLFVFGSGLVAALEDPFQAIGDR